MTGSGKSPIDHARDLNVLIQANPKQKRHIIQKFYAQMVADGEKETADLVLTIRSMMEAGESIGPKIWEKITAVVFGIIFVSVLLAIAIFIPHPTQFQIFVFRVVLALAAGGLGAVIPGLIQVQAGPFVRAGGAIALFVIVFWFNPPQLLVGKDSQDEDHSPIDVTLKLTPEFIPHDNKRVWVKATFTNSGTRQVSIAMFGLRLWKQQWSNNVTVQSSPTLLIFSDTYIKDCPPSICPDTSPNARLLPFSHVIILPGKGLPYEEKFGPYEISPEWVRKGFWLEGWAYTHEQDEGTCAVAGPPIVKGAFPQFCDSKKLGQKECYKLNDCKAAYSASVYVSFPKSSH
jgi:hypothetical protein